MINNSPNKTGFVQRLMSFFASAISPSERHLKTRPNPRPSERDLSYVGHEAYGRTLRNIVHAYCNANLPEKSNLDSNSNLAKHLRMANHIVGIFHHSNPLVLNGRTLIPNQWDGPKTFEEHLPNLLAIDIPELNERKEHFARSLNLYEGLSLVDSIMCSVFYQDIVESNLDQLPQPNIAQARIRGR